MLMKMMRRRSTMLVAIVVITTIAVLSLWMGAVQAAVTPVSSGFYSVSVTESDGIYPYLESPTYLPAADDTVNYVDLPSSFTFFGSPYTSVGIGSNGELQFGTRSTSGSPQEMPIGNLDLRPFIAFSYTDLQALEDDDRSYGSITDASGPSFLIRYRTVRYFNSPGRVTIDVLLRLDSNQIDIVIYRLDPSGSQRVLIGVQRSSADYAYVVNAQAIDSTLSSDLVGMRINFRPTGVTPPSTSVSTDELGCPLIKTPRAGSVIATVGLSFPTAELYAAYGSSFGSVFSSYIASYLGVSQSQVVCASIRDRSEIDPSNSIIQFAVIKSDEVTINDLVEDMADDLSDALSALYTDSLVAFSKLRGGGLFDGTYTPLLQQICLDGLLAAIDECSEALTGVSALGRASLSIGITLISLLFVSFWIFFIRSYNNTRTYHQMEAERNEKSFEKQKSKRAGGVFMDLDGLEMQTSSSSKSNGGVTTSNGRTKSLLASDSLLGSDLL